MEITINNKRISYFKEGNGVSTIIFVHGWGGSSNSLRDMFDLAKETYTSVIIDLPGFGDSDMPEQNWGTEEYAELLKDFIVKLELKNITYVGHSFGGALGVYLASKYPSLINKLILLAPAYKRSTKTTTKINNPIYKKFKKYIWPIRKIYYKIKYPQSQALFIPKLEENFAKIVSQDLTENLKNINQPTLIMWGTDDKLTPIKNLELAKQLIPLVEIKVLQNKGHAFPIREPNETFQQIKSFLENKYAN